MKGKEKAELTAGLGLLAVFGAWTLLVRTVDVRPAGPDGSSVGLAAFNVWFHRVTGVHMTLYTVTDWLGLIPVLVCVCFGILGAVQLFGRGSLRKVDPDLVLLGVYYILVIAAYLFFEMVPVNYRPVLIDGVLETSYPSSTTLLVLSVMLTLVYQANRRLTGTAARKAAVVFAVGFSVFMVAGRLLAGVHWATDIIGSILLSSGLFSLYRFAAGQTGRSKTGTAEKRQNDGV